MTAIQNGVIRFVSRRGRGRPAIDFSKVDWTQPNAEIAKQCGCCESTVSKFRSKMCMPRGYNCRVVRDRTVRRVYGRMARFYDFDSVEDWDRPQAEIARQLGCSRQRVAQVMDERGIPARGKRNTVMAWFKANPHKRGKVTVGDIAMATGISKCHVYNTVKMHDIPILKGYRVQTGRYVRPWDDINWDLPNTVLRDIWKLQDPPTSTTGQSIGGRRYRQNRGTAKWRARGHISDPEYYIAIINEEAKARVWFKKQRKQYGL